MNKSIALMMAMFFKIALPAHATSLLSPLPIRFNELARQCSNSGINPNTLQAIARVESGFNPYAIGVVKGSLKRQPRNLAEAVATAKSLHAQGKNFSMGLMQINRDNLKAYGLNYETVFDPCKNINVGARILRNCFDRAGGQGQGALHKAFSCYYSGNFTFGFKSDIKGQPPYVRKVLMAAMDNSPHQTINFSGSLKGANPVHLLKTKNVSQPTQQSAMQVAQSEMTDLTFSDETVTQSTQSKPKQSWDIFEEF